MGRRNRTPEEKARREKIRELLEAANVESMDDIQSLFRDTIAEFMENGEPFPKKQTEKTAQKPKERKNAQACMI